MALFDEEFLLFI